MSSMSTEQGQVWLDRMATEEPQTEFVPGTTYQPHDGEVSDFNLHYADMASGPNENVPDIMAGWQNAAAAEPTS